MCWACKTCREENAPFTVWTDQTYKWWEGRQLQINRSSTWTLLLNAILLYSSLYCVWNQVLYDDHECVKSLFLCAAQDWSPWIIIISFNKLISTFNISGRKGQYLPYLMVNSWVQIQLGLNSEKRYSKRWSVSNLRLSTCSSVLHN